MISTGNDIVSLNAINKTRTNQAGFYSKILSPTEKALYKHAAFAATPFENFVWLLWSIKESAYKYLKRSNPGLVFIPIKFIVKQLSIPPGYALKNFEATQTEGAGFENMAAFKGIITFGTNTLYSMSLIYSVLIVSVVNNNENFENTYWGVKLIDNPGSDYQSKAARKFLTDRLHNVVPPGELIISKNSSGIPIVLKDGEELGIAISLSHHDRFVGYSFQV